MAFKFAVVKNYLNNESKEGTAGSLPNRYPFIRTCGTKHIYGGTSQCPPETEVYIYRPGARIERERERESAVAIKQE